MRWPGQDVEWFVRINRGREILTVIEVSDIRPKRREVGRGPKKYCSVDTIPHPDFLDRLGHTWQNAKSTRNMRPFEILLLATS